VQAGDCASMVHEQKKYLRFVAQHSLTASIAACSPPSAAPHRFPHQPICTPPLIHSASAESLGRGPFARRTVNGSAQGSAQGSTQGSTQGSVQGSAQGSAQ